MKCVMQVGQGLPRVVFPDMLVRRVGNVVRVVSVYDANYHLVIDFNEGGYNKLWTISNLALVPNTSPVPVPKEGASDMIVIYNAQSDSCPAPYSTRRNATPAVYPEWVGGTHVSDTYYNLLAPTTPPESYPDVIPHQLITAIDAAAHTVTLADATLFPTPNSGEFHLFAYGKGVTSAFATIGHFKYTGKSGNTLTGVEPYVNETAISGITGIGSGTPPRAAFVMKTAKPKQVPDYLLDGAVPADNTWTSGKKLVITTVNELYDPTSLRHNPNTSTAWDKFFEETIVFTITPGACIDVLYEAVCLKANIASAYYGMQTQLVSLFSAGFTKMHYGHSANVLMQNISANSDSGFMNSYPNADKLIQYDPTNKRIHCCRMDLSYGTPAAYSTMVTNLATNKRFFGNAVSKFYFTNIAGKVLAVNDVVQWRGSYIEQSNRSGSANTLAYFSYENGRWCFNVDVTGSETFPYTETFNHLWLNRRTLTVAQKDDTITLSGYGDGRVDVPGDGLVLVASAYGTVKIYLS